MPHRALVLCAVAAMFVVTAVLTLCTDGDIPPGSGPSAATISPAAEVAPVGGAVVEVVPLPTERFAAPALVPSTSLAEPPTARRPPVEREAAERLLGLYVRVVHRGAPLPGQMVQLFPRSSVGDERATWGAAARGRGLGARVAITDGRGFATFPGRLPHGALAAVECEGALVWRKIGPVTVIPERCDIEIGTAAVDGIVYDRNGAPCAGALVRGGGDTRVGDPRWVDREVVTALSDANGRFALRGLPTEVVDVWCEWPDDAQRHEQCQVAASGLRPAFVRFGEVPGSGWWRGCLVDTAGVEVPGCTRIQFQDAASGELRAAFTEADGSFAVRLPAGRWRGWRSTDHAPDPAAVTTADVDARGEQHGGIVAPGHRVMLRLQAAHEGVDVRMAELALQLQCGDRRAVNRPAIDWNGGRYLVWNGLDAGVYRLRSQNGPLRCVGEPEGGFTLDLTGAVPLVQFEVVLAMR